jgi:hypothetical protein
MRKCLILGFGLSFLVTIALTGCGRQPADKAQGGAESAEKGHDHGPGGHEMPKGVGGTQFERELFLTPGGVYTKADIDANGNTIPSEKFTGIRWTHDDDLKTGDKLCPVTANKADQRCYWIVNAKQYEFCCTPCLDKFVKWAKERPEKIKDPQEYVHR